MRKVLLTIRRHFSIRLSASIVVIRWILVLFYEVTVSLAMFVLWRYSVKWFYMRIWIIQTELNLQKSMWQWLFNRNCRPTLFIYIHVCNQLIARARDNLFSIYSNLLHKSTLLLQKKSAINCYAKLKFTALLLYKLFSLAYPAYSFIMFHGPFLMLKEYYEIVDEARPLSGFFPTHADFFTEMHL